MSSPRPSASRSPTGIRSMSRRRFAAVSRQQPSRSSGFVPCIRLVCCDGAFFLHGDSPLFVSWDGAAALAPARNPLSLTKPLLAFSKPLLNLYYSILWFHSGSRLVPFWFQGQKMLWSREISSLAMLGILC